MAGVCSWCGTPLEDEVGKVEFLCNVCNTKIVDHERLAANPRRDWKPWMPGDAYPKLDRGDSRRV